MKSCLLRLSCSFFRLTALLTVSSGAVCILGVEGCGGNGNNSQPATTPLALSWATPASVSYGTPLSAAQLDATANVAGTFVYTPANGTILTAGSDVLSAVFTPADMTKYSQTTVTTTLVIKPISPVIAYAPMPLFAGQPVSTGQQNAVVTSSVNQSPLAGTTVYTPALGTAFAAGSQTFTATFTPADNVDYTTATQTTTLTVTNSAAYTYKPVPIIGGGFITGIVAHPGASAASPLRYARTDVGGAYRSTTAATTDESSVTDRWVPITDQFGRSQSGYQGIESIGIDPNDVNKLYLAVGMYAESFGGNGAFLISSDQGKTYTTVPVNFKMGSNDAGRYAGERLAVDPNLGTKLYFGSRLNGLQSSTDGGMTWNQVASFPVTGPTSGVGVAFVDFVKSSGSSGSATPVVYVGVSDTGTSTTGYSSLYRSIDGGATWQVVPGQPTGYYPSHGNFGPDGALYLSYSNGVGPNGVTAGALYRYLLPASTNPGGAGSFVNITPGAPERLSYSQGGYGTIVPDPNNPGVLMATTMDNYYPYGDDIYRSVDYGAHWISLDQQKAVHTISTSPWVTFGGTTAATGNWPGTLIIDPFNSKHVMYGNGQTIWDTVNADASDSGGVQTFSIGAVGIEETVVLALISPRTGAYVVSGVGDLGGMVHTSLTQSPVNGLTKPVYGNGTGLDFAEASPAIIARVGNSGGYGSYSTDGGMTFTAFPTLPPGTTSGSGTIAVSADGKTFAWAPGGAGVAYTTDNGATWTVATGATANAGIIADRVNARKFYILSGNTLQASTDGGKTFVAANNNLSGGTLRASFAAEGDLWITSSSGIFHSTDSGVTFGVVPGGFSQAYAISFGKAALTYPAIYVVGVAGGVYGFFRSVDGGATWIQINDVAHQFGYVQPLAADPKTFGRFYLGTGGRGILYGDSLY